MQLFCIINLVVAAWAVVSASQPVLSRNLTLHPLPNPFPIADTPFSVDFHAAAPIIISTPNYQTCLDYAGAFLMNRVRQHHNRGIIPLAQYPNVYERRCGNVFFEFTVEEQRPTQPDVHWSDALRFLQVVGWKMAREGVRQRIAFVVLTETGEDVAAMSFTRIGPVAPAQVETA